MAAALEAATQRRIVHQELSLSILRLILSIQYVDSISNDALVRLFSPIPMCSPPQSPSASSLRTNGTIKARMDVK